MSLIERPDTDDWIVPDEAPARPDARASAVDAAADDWIVPADVPVPDRTVFDQPEQRDQFAVPRDAQGRELKPRGAGEIIGGEIRRVGRNVSDFISGNLKTVEPGPEKLTAPFGVEIRDGLYPGEAEFFKNNPHVAGMAADDGRVILNPFSNQSSAERQAVVANEAARVHMRRSRARPTFAITDEQRAAFKGTPYENNDEALRETIAARIFSGDPSAGAATPEQKAFVARNLKPRTVEPSRASHDDNAVERGNIDLSKRPRVRNADGTISTLRSMSFNEDGLEVLVPTIADDGRQMTSDEAIAHYRRTGKHLSKFANPEEATMFAESLSRRQGGSADRPELPVPDPSVFGLKAQGKRRAPASAPNAVARGFVSGLLEQNPEMAAETLEGFSHLAPDDFRETLQSASTQMRDVSKLRPEEYQRYAGSLWDAESFDEALTWAGETLGQGVASSVPSVVMGTGG
ncbi:MAG: hypothetical protein GEU95_01315, partial [Rhizobiales bacterium]|nr:hypothetical protein [Hyphomicrobiales bacterium]